MVGRSLADNLFPFLFSFSFLLFCGGIEESRPGLGLWKSARVLCLCLIIPLICVLSG